MLGFVKLRKGNTNFEDIEVFFNYFSWRLDGEYGLYKRESKQWPLSKSSSHYWQTSHSD